MRALSHPLRAEIYHAMGHGAVSPQDLARELDVPVENVAYHVRRLSELGLVTQVGTEKRGGRTARLYEAELRFADDETTAALSVPIRHALIRDTLARVDTAVNEALRGGGFKRSDFYFTRYEFWLTDAEWRELAGMLLKVHERAAAFEKRRAGPSSDAHIAATGALMLFEAGD